MNYDRVKQIFTEAIKLPPEDRGAYLDEQCGDDPELRAEIDSILEKHLHTVIDQQLDTQSKPACNVSRPALPSP